MQELVHCLAHQMDWETGRLTGAAETLSRRLADLAGLFSDEAAEREAISRDNPLVYQVFLPILREDSDAGELQYGSTVIYPGQVGEEYFMTKGHFHSERECPEVYLGCHGQGMLVLMDREGRAEALPMQPGTIAYVPPDTAHRTVNVGRERFVFFAVWPRRAGHDYETIARHGFSHRILEQHGRPVMVSNPEWRHP